MVDAGRRLLLRGSGGGRLFGVHGTARRRRRGGTLPGFGDRGRLIVIAPILGTPPSHLDLTLRRGLATTGRAGGPRGGAHARGLLTGT